MAVGGFRASVATPWFAFFSFSVTPGYSASAEGLSKGVGALSVLALPTPVTSELVSVLEPDETGARMAGVVNILCPPKYR